MPITVKYAPDLQLTGQVANQIGQGQGRRLALQEALNVQQMLNQDRQFRDSLAQRYWSQKYDRATRERLQAVDIHARERSLAFQAEQRRQSQLLDIADRQQYRQMQAFEADQDRMMRMQSQLQQQQYNREMQQAEYQQRKQLIDYQHQQKELEFTEAQQRKRENIMAAIAEVQADDRYSPEQKLDARNQLMAQLRGIEPIKPPEKSPWPDNEGIGQMWSTYDDEDGTEYVMTRNHDGDLEVLRTRVKYPKGKGMGDIWQMPDGSIVTRVDDGRGSKIHQFTESVFDGMPNFREEELKAATEQAKVHNDMHKEIWKVKVEAWKAEVARIQGDMENKNTTPLPPMPEPPAPVGIDPLWEQRAITAEQRWRAERIQIAIDRARQFNIDPAFKPSLNDNGNGADLLNKTMPWDGKSEPVEPIPYDPNQPPQYEYATDPPIPFYGKHDRGSVEANINAESDSIEELRQAREELGAKIDDIIKTAQQGKGQ